MPYSYVFALILPFLVPHDEIFNIMLTSKGNFLWLIVVIGVKISGITQLRAVWLSLDLDHCFQVKTNILLN